MRSLRELIKLILEQEEVLGEPDESAEDEREKDSDEQSVAGAVPGATTPLGTGPTYPADIKKKNKKRLGDKKKK